MCLFIYYSYIYNNIYLIYSVHSHSASLAQYTIQTKYSTARGTRHDTASLRSASPITLTRHTNMNMNMTMTKAQAHPCPC